MVGTGAMASSLTGTTGMEARGAGRAPEKGGVRD